MRKRRFGAVIAATAISAGPLVGAACSAKTDPPPGAVMVSIDTNFKAGSDIDAVGIQASLASGAKTWEDDTFELLPLGTSVFPATFAVVRGTDQPIAVRVIGYKDGQAIAVRDAITTIPPDHTALLRMDIEWLDKGSAVANPAAAAADGGTTSAVEGKLPRPSTFSSICGANATSIAGSCKPLDTDVLAQESDAGVLPTFEDAGFVSSQDTTRCLDVDACFAGFGTPDPTTGKNKLDVTLVTGSDKSCSFVPPTSDTSALNVGFRLGAGKNGWCDDSGCVLPIVKDANVGWYVDGAGRVQLPPSVCTNTKIVAVVATSATTGTSSSGATVACPVKTRNVPACQTYPNAASSGGDDAAADATILDAAPDAQPVDAGPNTRTFVASNPVGAITVDDHFVYLFETVNGSGTIEVLNRDLSKPSGALSPQAYSKAPLTAAYVASASFPWLALNGIDGMYLVAVGANGTLGTQTALFQGEGSYNGTNCPAGAVSLQPLSGGVRVSAAMNCSGGGGGGFEYVDVQPDAGLGGTGGIDDSLRGAYNPADQSYIASFNQRTARSVRYGELVPPDGGTQLATELVVGAIQPTMTPLSFAFTASQALWNNAANQLVWAPLDGTDDGGAYALASNVVTTSNAITATPTRAFWISNGTLYSSRTKSSGFDDAGVADYRGAAITLVTFFGTTVFWVDANKNVYAEDESNIP